VEDSKRFSRRLWVSGVFCTLVLGTAALYAPATPEAAAGGWPWRRSCDCQTSVSDRGAPIDEVGGTWQWMRSPDEEKRVVSGLYNRYCIRCHGVDGRGVWDIPGVPDFTNPRWQTSRSDAQRARIILEGRGAVMPPFRGALSLEESWAIGRYLHTFVPGTEVSRPDLRQPGDSPGTDKPKKQ
jgi:mono/diheme cytochrome c family protein